MESAAAAALGRLEHFASRDLANLLWSPPTLELQINRDILTNAHEILALRLPTEAADVQHKALNRMREPHVVAEVFDFLTTLLELSWALAFSGQQQPRLAGLLRSSLRRIATALDDSGLARHSRSYALLLWSCASDVVAPAHLDSPEVVLDLPDIAVVLKPPHWEVDARPKEELQAEDVPGGAARISRFLQGIYSWEEYPLLFSEVHQFGIIHRLDVPSSGLILVGKTFVGYFTLRWQQDTYELGRHYLVLCHGHLSAGKHIINARIKTSKTFPATSRVSAAGKPAWTQVEALCLLARGDQPFSLLLVLIRTGRTHQIRVHLQHAGHPTVCDEKYTDPAVFAQDVAWCPRNFLHRFELTFQDCDGQARAARAAMPEDLQAVLATLRAIEGEEIRSALLRGWVPEV
eukprot:s4071_g2.t2